MLTFFKNSRYKITKNCNIKITKWHFFILNCIFKSGFEFYQLSLFVTT